MSVIYISSEKSKTIAGLQYWSGAEWHIERNIYTENQKKEENEKNEMGKKIELNTQFAKEHGFGIVLKIVNMSMMMMIVCVYVCLCVCNLHCAIGVRSQNEYCTSK